MELGIKFNVALISTLKYAYRVILDTAILANRIESLEQYLENITLSDRKCQHQETIPNSFQQK